MRQIKDTLISLCYAVVLIAAVSFAMCGVARCSRPHSPAPMPVGDTVRVTDRKSVCRERVYVLV